MDTLTLIHTAAGNVAAFGKLLDEIAPDIPVQHVVDNSLIAEARARGISPGLNRRVTNAILNASDSGARTILCTCSSIGPCAEVARPLTDRPVLRVDAPMAEEAVSRGKKIVVAATLQSTLGPTMDILQAAADAKGATVDLIKLLCSDAWESFERGDTEAYEQKIAAELERAGADADLIVLAQASMAGAAQRCQGLTTPILTSPESGLKAAIESYRSASPQA